ncbi:hypothetical protein QLH32_05560 [Acinetobacter corruptisaponis]|uniref:Uncharacterized protein n=1 Tax=Acinetobacter corruptisaponis TaxID=3045147 RepID=A0ABY8S7K4_9GAMM|nr:hypothetical protein [Acinetobacter sp. KCTC 92772]AZM38917.1 hypothetical protein EJP75_10420 [Acinetobacter baumannii]WHP06934.1 hypothetical protein QLH32_05560 [Acinetobacter sp. KCTC 92772]
MTTTNVSICNEALSMIGAKSIISFDESTENARRCASIYDSTRKALLRMHPWSFAKKRVQLAPISTHPSFGYAHAFPLPNDFMRVYDAGEINYEIEGRHILADTSLINLVYVYDNDNEQTWDSLFTECMALYLVRKLAKPITGSQAEADSAWAQLQGMLKQARAINGQERPAQEFAANYESTLLGVRY